MEEYIRYYYYYDMKQASHLEVIKYRGFGVLPESTLNDYNELQNLTPIKIKGLRKKSYSCMKQ